MRAAIIVRSRQTDTIAHLLYVDALDGTTVRDAIVHLYKQFSPREYRVDTSQVQLARQALAAA